jgi:hypothetical protein
MSKGCLSELQTLKLDLYRAYQHYDYREFIVSAFNHAPKLEYLDCCADFRLLIDAIMAKGLTAATKANMKSLVLQTPSIDKFRLAFFVESAFQGFMALETLEITGPLSVGSDASVAVDRLYQQQFPRLHTVAIKGFYEAKRQDIHRLTEAISTGGMGLQHVKSLSLGLFRKITDDMIVAFIHLMPRLDHLHVQAKEFSKTRRERLSAAATQFGVSLDIFYEYWP